MESNTLKKALIIRPGSFGDTVATFPVFYSLKKALYNVYLIGSRKMIEYLEKIKLIEKGIGFDDIRLLKFFIHQQSFDNLPDMPFFDIIIAYIEQEGILAGNILNKYKDKAIFHPVPEEPPYHITDFLLEPLHKSGIKTISKIHPPRRGISKGIFFIHPGSGSKKKNLPREYFLRVFSELKRMYKCKIIIGECEKSEKDYWIENAGIEYIVETEKVSNLADELEKGSFFIGNDSGVSHLASFLGLNTFIIFGPTNPEIWAPKGNNVTIIQTSAKCAPCNYQIRKQCDNTRCLTEISVEHIISTVIQTINRDT
ncbi:MAG TPA: glycosyltransferase family 9 protein [Candidatus Ratteibacteria bacterium]|nr:glycosyltransferase family 9 protein [Candidatus Ratteibacteria bacterium]HRV05222.1 glycosyltransferase family 9 protein [Candidatus Ratteibacteria bacterium]